MKVFGYEKDVEGPLKEMKIISLCFESTEEASRFVKFANYCVELMREDGDDFGHEHFCGGSVPDITIERLIETKQTAPE